MISCVNFAAPWCGGRDSNAEREAAPAPAPVAAEPAAEEEVDYDADEPMPDEATGAARARGAAADRGAAATRALRVQECSGGKREPKLAVRLWEARLGACQSLWSARGVFAYKLIQ